MEDTLIINLFWKRSETAIKETQKKYGKYCNTIAYNILNSFEDAEECTNDAYFRVWNTVPPNRPNKFKAYVGKITRNLALDRYDRIKAKKRYNGKTQIVFDEFKECIPDKKQDFLNELELKQNIEQFLIALEPKTRNIFLQRYWYFYSIKDIAKGNNINESNVKMILLRTRKSMRVFLEKEGVAL